MLLGRFGEQFDVPEDFQAVRKFDQGNARVFGIRDDEPPVVFGFQARIFRADGSNFVEAVRNVHNVRREFLQKGVPQFRLEAGAKAIALYSVDGIKVAETAGETVMTDNLAAGLYIAVATIDGKQLSRKLVIR